MKYVWMGVVMVLLALGIGAAAQDVEQPCAAADVLDVEYQGIVQREWIQTMITTLNATAEDNNMIDWLDAARELRTVLARAEAACRGIPSFEEEVNSVQELPAVMSVEAIKRDDGDYYAIVTTHPQFNKESFAQLIQIQAIKVDVSVFRFAVRIDDGGIKPLWWVDDGSGFRHQDDPPMWVLDLTLRTETGE